MVSFVRLYVQLEQEFQRNTCFIHLISQQWHYAWEVRLHHILRLNLLDYLNVGLYVTNPGIAFIC